jgi:tRNA G18 (ribose-2'-O)-methylase SpoU
MPHTDPDFFRTKTRVERIEEKQKTAIQLPVRIATVNFDYDENLGLMIRAAACYGAKEVVVFGRVPHRVCFCLP